MTYRAKQYEAILSAGYILNAGGDPGFLEKGFIYVKLWGDRFADLIETQLFHFHRIFNNGEGGRDGVRANPLWIHH